MKTSQRIPKAIALTAIVGISFLYNMKEKNVFQKPLLQLTDKNEYEPFKADTAIMATETQLFIFTKSIIKTSIQHLISNI